LHDLNPNDLRHATSVQHHLLDDGRTTVESCALLCVAQAEGASAFGDWGAIALPVSGVDTVREMNQ
jgi:hypothetical protein